MHGEATRGQLARHLPCCLQRTSGHGLLARPLEGLGCDLPDAQLHQFQRRVREQRTCKAHGNLCTSMRKPDCYVVWCSEGSALQQHEPACTACFIPDRLHCKQLLYIRLKTHSFCIVR